MTITQSMMMQSIQAVGCASKSIMQGLFGFKAGNAAAARNAAAAQQQRASGVLSQASCSGGNVPIASQTGLVGAGGGVVPPTLLEEHRVPRFYIDAIQACGAGQGGLPHTALVYNMMVTSGLPRPMLSYIWSAVNRTLPGQLTRAEFFSCLALIALAQRGESLAALCSMSQLPIPHLQSCSAVPAGGGGGATTATAAAPVVNVMKQAASIVPSSLLPEKRKEKREKDLIGEQLPSSSFSSAPASTPTPTCSAMDDLSGLDWGPAPVDAMESVALEVPVEKEKVVEEEEGRSGPREECWSRCAEALEALFSEAERLIDGKSDAVLSEVWSTERGAAYLDSLHRAYAMMRRIERKGSSLAGVLAASTVAARVWKRLHEWAEEGAGERERDGEGPSCLICHHSCVDAVQWSGHSFHPVCANLWVNRVDPTLPHY